MTPSVVIAPRYCGPPGIGNGGYVCGIAAGYVGGPAEVTLRLPAPLARPLLVERNGRGSVRLMAGPAVIAEATTLAGGPDVQVPDPVSVGQARAAGALSPLRTRPELHPFPACFVCGPGRPPGDGLHVCVGPVPGTALAADLWIPGEDLAGAGGQVRSEFIWAALDCPSGFGALPGVVPDGATYLLGRLAAAQTGDVRVGEPHIVMGWRVAAEGRKVVAGSALFTAHGQPVAVARATWIRVRAQVA
jgi:hypothetical protein